MHTRYQKIMALMVTAILLLFSGLMLRQELSASLLDIQETPYHTSFSYLLSRGIIDGYPDKTGRPYAYINRAEVVKVLVNAREDLRVNIPAIEKDLPIFPLFIDTYQDQWYASYLELGYKEQLVTGYPDGSFRPAQLVRVEEAVALLTRAFKLHETRTDVVESDFIENRANEWFTPPINAAVARNLVQHKTNLRLGTAMTRGQFFDMLYRLHLITNLDQAMYQGPEPFDDEAPLEEAPPVENIIISAEQPNTSSPVAVEYGGDTEIATEIAAPPPPPVIATPPPSSGNSSVNAGQNTGGTNINANNNGSSSNGSNVNSTNNGGGSTINAGSSNGGNGGSTINAGNSGNSGSNNNAAAALIFNPDLPIEYVDSHPEKSFLPYAMNLPSIGIRNVPILRPTSVTSRAGLESILDKGIGNIMNQPGGGGNEFYYGHSSSYVDTLYSRIFRAISGMNPGDKFYVTYQGIVFEYQVDRHEIIEAADTSVYRDSGIARAVLYTCHPPGGFSHRYVVYGTPVKAYIIK